MVGRSLEAALNGTGKEPRSRLRLLVADDSPEVIQEIVHLLHSQHDILRTVPDGRALVEAASELHPDLVVSDFSMPGLNGIDAGRHILQQGYCRNVILLTMYSDAQLVSAAVAAGIAGFVLKADAGEELHEAIRRVAAGDRYISRGLDAGGKYAEDKRPAC